MLQWLLSKRQEIISVKNVEKRELLYTAGANVNWYNHGKQYRDSSKIKNRTYDLVISLLDIYPEETKTLTQKDIYISIFIAALFTLVNIRKQPKCPSKDKWVKKMWCIYTMFISHIKRGNRAICNKDGP